MKTTVNKDMAEEERRREMRNNFPDDIKNVSFHRVADPSTIRKWTDDLVNAHMEMRRIKDEQYLLNEAIKAEKDAINRLVDNLNGGGEHAEEECYGFIEADRMVYYNIDGEEVSSRPLNPAERGKQNLFRQQQSNE